MLTLQTPYGVVPTEKYTEVSADGAVLACQAGAECVLSTALGELVPQYTTDDLRKKEVLPLVFHPSGTLKACPLERQTVVPTPAGLLPAELLTFHPSGAVNRVFPLNGRLSGYWGQEDEGRLAEPVRLQTPVGELHARIISACFFEDGGLRSVTLWPGEVVDIPTPAGMIRTRVGVSFYPGGKVRSVEPAIPTSVTTPIGKIVAFDSDVVGISGDLNSLVFDEQGGVQSIITSLSSIVVPGAGGGRYSPVYRESLCGDEEREVTPMRVVFKPHMVLLQNGPDEPYTRIALSSDISITPFMPQLGRPLGDLRCSV